MLRTSMTSVVQSSFDGSVERFAQVALDKAIVGLQVRTWNSGASDWERRCAGYQQLQWRLELLFPSSSAAVCERESRTRQRG